MAVAQSRPAQARGLVVGRMKFPVTIKDIEIGLVIRKIKIENIRRVMRLCRAFGKRAKSH